MAPPPKGQTLYVTDGIGDVARRGKDGTSQPQEIRPGDVVYIEPGEEHWHGATPNESFAHLAFSFGVTEWIGPVEEE